MNSILSRLAAFGAFTILLVGCDAIPAVAPRAHEQDPATKAPFAIQLSDGVQNVRKGSGTFEGAVVTKSNTMDASFQDAIRSIQSAGAGQPAIRNSSSVSHDLVTAPSLLPAPDLMWYSETGSATIWKMNGAAFAGTGATFVQIPVAWRVAAAADINGDGKTDLIVENTTTGDHIVLYMNGAVYSGSQAPLLKTPLDYKLAAVADVNGDGKFDLIFENKTDGSRIVSMYNGASYTGVTITVGTLPVEWGIGAAGDFNGDGQADVVVQNRIDGSRKILFMQGTSFNGQFAVLPSVNPTNNVIGAARFNWNPSGDVHVSDVAGLRAAVANATPNTRILIAAGTYDLGNTHLKVDGKSNLEIDGAGRGQTILKVGSSARFVIELAGVLSNITIAHMTLLGATTLATNTQALATGDNVSLTTGKFWDLDIRNAAVGISVDNSISGACTGVEIVGNYLDNIQDFPNPTLGGTSGSGYGIANEGCVDLRIADNVIRNADRHGIYQAKANQGDRPGFGKIVIEHNLIIDHAKTSSLDAIWLIALVVARSSNVVVANNIIVNPYHIAMSIENEAPTDPQWNVTDVRLINNVVIGPREMDVYFSASGPFTFWGNRFYHRDGSSSTTPVVVRAGYGVSGTLVEPSTLTGTQAMAAGAPYDKTYAFRTGVIQRLTTAYNSDPATWALANSPFLFTGFEDMAAAPGFAYVMANRTLTEVNTTTWARRDSPITFPAASMVGFSDGNLAAISNGQIYRVNVGTLDGSAAPLPGSGPVRGMAMFGDKTYFLSGSCTYEIKTSDLTTVSSVC